MSDPTQQWRGNKRHRSLSHTVAEAGRGLLPYLLSTFYPHGLGVEVQVLVQNRVHGLFKVQLSALTVLQSEETEGGLLKDLPTRRREHQQAQGPSSPLLRVFCSTL